MKIISIAMLVVATTFVSSISYNQAQDYPSHSESTVPLKHAQGRLKAIARAHMIENQKITKPFELHQNWKFIKKDIYKKLKDESYINEYKQRVVNENVIPTMEDKVFKKLARLRTGTQDDKRKKYAPTEDQISMKKSVNIVRDRLRKYGISEKDKLILFKEIMQELKKYEDENNLINRKTVKSIADDIIKRFKEHKLNVTTEETQSYLQKFISDGYKKRFEEQLKAQEWGAIP